MSRRSYERFVYEIIHLIRTQKFDTNVNLRSSFFVYCFTALQVSLDYCRGKRYFPKFDMIKLRKIYKNSEFYSVSICLGIVTKFRFNVKRI